MVSEDGSMGKVRFQECFDNASHPSQVEFLEEDERKRQQQLLHDREAMESLLAKLFASVSAVKAAYAQLQMAQAPYDPDTIQSADHVVVSELKQLSQLKQSYYKRQIHGGSCSARDVQLLAEMQEQRNLIKAFQITAKKMETDLQDKDAEIILLKDQLSEAEKVNRVIEGKVHPERSLQMVDGLRLSDLNPTHFPAVLRYAVKSIRAFAKVMASGMERAGWDLDAAAASIERDVVCGNPEHRAFVFESYACRTIFSDFQHHEFGLRRHAVSSPLPDRRRFFDEFVELKLAKLKQLLQFQSTGPAFQEFCRAKYLKMVHERMEEAFFGNLDHRSLVGSGNGFPETEFFLGFAEMARRVWLLHRLFFSFEPQAQASIFQARKGCRFSEVFMESVADPGGVPGWPEDANPAVGFAVVPGFMVGKTVVRCRVYLVTAGARR